ncbi:ADP-ribose pyrophosphatase YjhB (NUDIX family) [Kordia periserrulae]|uniref:ADP-ribose pyrophosphatase YjhB (NUDIX family) n=1 Tax=Kordia periserrulae TaxID=701523 RepID=A0A2T6C117_9FLAO|nr:NUDIX hydrolase [Kordia periserrulae]PTX62005.1 ADP-ribose pyrophosphatase YjhB (NUDIX family) [Kordia periserrulae]
MKIIHKSRLIAVNKEQLLVVEKLGNTKKLTLPGGVKKRSESLEKSLARETKEEIGLWVDRHQVSHVVSSVQSKDKNIVIKHHFAMKLTTNLFHVREKEKFKDVYWCFWKDALPYLDKEDKKAVKKYFKRNFSKKPKPSKDESSIPPSIAM